jgi:hypothetical protein
MYKFRDDCTIYEIGHGFLYSLDRLYNLLTGHGVGFTDRCWDDPLFETGPLGGLHYISIDTMGHWDTSIGIGGFGVQGIVLSSRRRDFPLSSHCIMAEKMRPSRGKKEKSRIYSPHVRRSMGHCCFDGAVSIHLTRQCIWNTWLHSPQTVSNHPNISYHIMSFATQRVSALSGHSSPGILHAGQHASNATRQIPHTSPSSSSSPDAVESLPVSQRQCATACQCLTTTFMVDRRVSKCVCLVRHASVVTRIVTPGSVAVEHE